MGGIPEWRFYNYPMHINHEWQAIKVEMLPPEEFQKAALLNENIVIVDTRPLEFEGGRLFFKGALHLPLIFLEERYQEIPKGKKVLLTDWAMKQSPMAAKFLLQKGYQVAAVLKGGIERYEKEILAHDLLEERTPPTVPYD